MSEYLLTDLPRYVKTTPREDFSNSVVKEGAVLLFSEDGQTLVAKNPDGSFTEIGSGSDTSAFESDAMAIIGTLTGGGEPGGGESGGGESGGGESGGGESGGGTISRNSLYYFPLDEDYTSHGSETWILEADGSHGFTTGKFGNAAAATGYKDLSSILGSGFTIDFWTKIPYVNPNTASHLENITRDFFSLTGAEISLFGYRWIFYSGAHKLSFFNQEIAFTPDDNWHHFAIVRSGQYVKLYMDGAEIASTGTDYVNASQHLYVGGFGNTSYTLTLDELHITDNALWTENFTPPTQANSLT